MKCAIDHSQRTAPEFASTIRTATGKPITQGNQQPIVSGRAIEVVGSTECAHNRLFRLSITMGSSPLVLIRSSPGFFQLHCYSRLRRRHALTLYGAQPMLKNNWEND